MSLKSQVLSGLKWSAISKLIAQLFSWVSTFLVIRVLTPEDYGLMAIVSVFFTFITIFTVNGFVTSLVQSQKLEKDVCNQIFTLSLSLYIFISIVISYFASNIASFYGNEQIENVIYAMALITPLNSFCIIPNAYLNIEMNFKAKAICESIAAFCSAIVALSFAYSGSGYWALFYALVTELAIRTILLNITNSYSYGFDARLNALKNILSFSFKIQLNQLIWFSYNKLDTLIVGKYLGIQQLGIYNVGVEIASLPMTKASALLNQVGLSAFSKVNTDFHACRYYLERAIKLLSLIIFPVFVGISSIAEELVLVFIGSKWVESGAIVAIFSLIFPFRMINSVIHNFLIAINQPTLAVQNTFIICFSVIVAILVGVQYGIFYTAIAWMTGFCLAFLVIIIRTKKHSQVKFSTLFCWFSPLIVSLLMWLLVWMTEILLSNKDISIIYMLCIKILVGSLFIVIAYSLLYRNDIKNLLQKK